MIQATLVERHAAMRDRLFEAGLLILGRASQVVIGSHAGANRTAGQAMLVQFLLHEGRIDMRWVFDWNFDGLKAPFLECLKEFCAFVGEGRSEQKSIDAKSHNGFFDRLEERQSVSKAFAIRRAGRPLPFT